MTKLQKTRMSSNAAKRLLKRYEDAFVDEFGRASLAAGQNLWAALRASKMGRERFAKRMRMSEWRCTKFLAGDCDWTIERLAEAASVLNRELRVTFVPKSRRKPSWD